MAVKCFVPGCKTGYKSELEARRRRNKKNLCVFKCPRNWTMFQIWRQVIPRVDKKFSITDRVCELHFTADEISKTYEQKCYDGSLFILERGRAKLSTGAIPTIFPQLPEYSRTLRKIVEQVRKDVPLFSSFAEDRAQKFIEEELSKYFLKGSLETQVESFEQNVSQAEIDTNEGRDFDATIVIRAEVEKNVCDIDANVCTVKNDVTSRTENDNLCDPDSLPENTDVNAEGMHAINVNEYIDDEIEPDEITYEVLLRNLSSISMPGNDWSITEHGDFVMCAKWDQDYIPIKRVVIDSNLNTKVFLKDKEFVAYKDVCISSISDISTILHLLNTDVV